MRHPPNQAVLILKHAEAILHGEEAPEVKLHRLWLTLAFLHAHALADGLRGQLGASVYSGPFKGMRLTPQAMDGAYAPVLLGAYERELHPFIEQAIARTYDAVLNIGCAYGYYSVGFALRLPHAEIHAFDIDENARRKCADMAALNGVSDRVRIGGEFKAEDFAAWKGKKALCFVDIEGAELQLLDPMHYPALAGLDLIVELHDIYNPAITKIIKERFAPTHDLTFLPNRQETFNFSPLFGQEAYVDAFDQFLVGWENRDGPTPWIVMLAKQERS